MIEATLSAAMAMVPACGITRVTDLTRLDIIGVPVFCAVRPLSKTLTVHSGKGLSPAHAKLSAVLEGVEYAYAERISPTLLLSMSPLDVFREFEIAVSSFCPKIGRSFDADLPMDWLMLEQLGYGMPIPAPAEVVYMPCPPPVGTGNLRPSSVGLACGIDVVRAALHGVCEVVEREIHSFDMFVPASRPVPLHLLSTAPTQLVQQIEDAGLAVALRSRRRFGLHYVDALVWNPYEPDPRYTNGGISCDPDFQSAALGAVLEAVQSRLSVSANRVTWLSQYTKGCVELLVGMRETLLLDSGREMVDRLELNAATLAEEESLV